MTVSAGRKHTLVRGGAGYVMARRLGFETPGRPRRLLKMLAIVGVAWVPLVILSIAEGHAFGDYVAVQLLHDWAMFSRFLFALPLLILGQSVVEAGLVAQARQFLESGLVAAGDRRSFVDAEEAAIEWRASKAADFVIFALALLSSVVVKVLLGLGSGQRGWVRSGDSITFAGWWYFLVSLPILTFYLLNWLWVFILWARFLFSVSRLDLELTPTHPDRAGGLGFLGWGMMSFGLVLIAVSAVISGGFAHEILHKNASLDDFKFHVIAFVVVAIGTLHTPLLAFVGRLARCRFQGLMEFETLIGCHDRAFDAKWVRSRETDRASLLGSPEVSSLADIAQVFEHVTQMRILPLDKQTIITLVLCTLLPMAPLVGTAVPLSEILAKLAELIL